jgi:hypothetical protein
MMTVDKRYNELFHAENKRRAYKNQDVETLLTYRSSLLIAVLICINLYMNDLNASGVVRVLVTLLSFVQLATFLEQKEEDQVTKILNPLFLVLGILLAMLYVVMKRNLL